MIVSAVDEAAWVRALTALPALQPPTGPVLVIAPHPDDETLAAGGFIAAARRRGLAVTVAAVTDGENAYPDSPGLAALRTDEQTNALARLGVPATQIHRFHLPDSSVAACEQELVERLLSLVSADSHILAPWRGDFHPDHEACARAAEQAASQTGARLTSWFFWTWHRGTPDLLQGLPLHSFPLNDDLLLAKREALLCHRSQLQHASGQPILPESLLAPARRPFEVFLPA